MIVIIDYGIGNHNSVKNMLKKIGIASVVSSDKEVIEKASKLILPGVGHFDQCMKEFKSSGLKELIDNKVLIDKIPVLGICVGCQMLMEESEEGTEAGLGWIKGKVVKFKKERLPSEYKIPHMSWSELNVKNGCTLFKDVADPRFYFVHSFHIDTDETNVTATAEYGYVFPASVAKENILGVQFHPEKSHKFGMQLLSNFAKFF